MVFETAQNDADGRACPVTHDFDLLSPERLLDPYPALEQLREASPVYYSPELDHYIVTRLGDIQAILLDRDAFSASNASSPMRPVGERAQRILDDGGFRRVPTLNNADPPRHAPMRKAVLRALSPRRIAALEPTVRDMANSCVDELGRHDTVDLVSTLSFPLPAQVIFALLGFPESDMEKLKSWCRERVLLTYGDETGDEQSRGATAVVEFWQYVREFVAASCAEPGDDTTGDLVAIHRESPDTVTQDDLVNILYSLALAGHETTTSLITNGLRQLLLHRHEWDQLCRDRSTIPNAIEESLRFDGPVVVHRRRAKVDARVGGVPIPADGRIMLVFAAAHRDGRTFERPDEFDIDRGDANLHLAFGKGAHYCLGAPLARLEMRVVLEVLSDRLPDLDLDPGRGPEFLRNMHFRSVSKLTVAPHGVH
jgi:hypothetical protein